MFGLGTQELILILIIVLIIFGAGRLPTIGTAIGQAIKNFKKSSSESDQKEKLESSSKPEEPSKKA